MSQENVFETPVETPVETTPTDEPKPTKEEFENLLNEGRKFFLVQNYSDAVEKLSQAAVFSVELFGEFAKETFTPHYYYGKALLELTSMEKDLMESKFDEEKFADDPIIGEIKEGIKTLAEKMMEAQAELAVAQEEQTSQANDTAQTENGEEEQEVIAEQKELDIDQTVGDEENEEEDIENAQLAFESLDYARLVCVKNADGSTEWLERQKNTLVLLGQLALNEDQFETAIEDLKNALEIVNTHFVDDFREIAFINMEIARVYRKTNDYPAANLHTDSAIKSLEQFKAKLESEPPTDDGKLLNEIKGFIDEVVDERNLTRIRECEEKENAVTREPVNLDEKSSDVLVIKRKEKRPAEDQVEINDEAKKSKVDEIQTDS